MIGVVVALAIANQATATWVADVRIWVQSDAAATAEVSELLTDPDVLQTTLDLSSSERTVDDLASAIQISADDGLLTVSLAGSSEEEAERLATSLAAAALDEHFHRTRGAVVTQVLGLTWPGAERASPHVGRDASLAAVAGLLGGIGIAAGLSRRVPAAAPSALALMGRRGWRPLALIPHNSRETKGPPRSAEQLADALAAQCRDGCAVAFIALHEDADAEIPALQAARALAGRGIRVLWLDARAERLVLIPLPLADAPSPVPVQTPETDSASLPPWLQGLSPPSWAELLGGRLAANRSRFDAIVAVGGQIGAEPRAQQLAAAADRLVLVSRDDFDASAAATDAAADALEFAASPILGVAVTHASERRADAFADAAESLQHDD